MKNKTEKHSAPMVMNVFINLGLFPNVPHYNCHAPAPQTNNGLELGLELELSFPSKHPQVSDRHGDWESEVCIILISERNKTQHCSIPAQF